MHRQALIVGATGAVGSKLLALCLEGDRYSRVTVIARRTVPFDSPKLNWIEAEFDTLGELSPVRGLADGDAYCCLGTTMKAAGSKAAFRQVDHDYVINAARFAQRCGVTHFSLVSAVGANAHSGVFYSRTKGEVEAAVAAMGFPSLHVFRPSLLTGARAEFRLKEEVGKWVSVLLTPLFQAGFRKFMPVDVSRLARALYSSAARHRMTGSARVYESDEIQTL